MADSYILRTLIDGDKPIGESDCFVSNGVYVVLAEPGAGKSDLLANIARRHNTKRWLASAFQHATQLDTTSVLIVDALDEVARTGDSATNQVIVKAIERKADVTVFSSRADVWSEERKRFLEEFSGSRPKVIRLEPFSKSEQKSIFENRFPEEDFEKFQYASIAFGLDILLGNPVFLRLFAEGFIQSGHKFTTKSAAFKSAVERLGSSDGKGSISSPTPPLTEILKTASELFAKMLLSGSSGISTVDQTSEPKFPYVQALSKSNPQAILNTRLFKPSDDHNFHEPFHRIVAEYCAATFLVEKIDDLSSRLSLKRCLALIAPNGVVRDDLRGMLGWMAALGTQTIQSEAIALDPYAVIANGDASQLTEKSKVELLNGLRMQAKQDPYFRRSDSWRSFSLVGFFTDAEAPAIEAVLRDKADQSHLRHLVLQMMQDNSTPQQLSNILEDIALDKSEEYTLRLLAARSFALGAGLARDALVRGLLGEPQPDCLKVTADLVLQDLPAQTDRALVLQLLQHAGRADIRQAEKSGSYSDQLYAINDVVRTRTIEDVTWLLDQLSAQLKCTCGATKTHECQCRNDASKVIGRLLDRFFELQAEPFDKNQIWSWIKNLHFGHDVSEDKSTAVKKLRACNSLRQDLQKTAFHGVTDREEIWAIQSLVQRGHMHGGISFSQEDQVVLVDWAFGENNVALWSALMCRHYRPSKSTTPLQMRTTMRKQASEKPEFMRIWAKHNIGWRKYDREQRVNFPRNRKWKVRDEKVKLSNRQALQENRSSIEAGTNWWWTHNFAFYFMYFPEKLHQLTDSHETVQTTLLNCIEALRPHWPTLQDLAEGEKRPVAEVLHAACLVHFRAKGSLRHIEPIVLRAVKTEVGSAKAYAEGEAEKLEAEIDRLLFIDDASRIAFATEYFESQLERAHCQLWRFKNNTAFEEVKIDLAWDWLRKHPNASLDALDTLFSICAQAGKLTELAKLISIRCAEIQATDLNDASELTIQRLEFWRLRNFFFCDDDEHGLWNDLLSDAKAVFAFENKAGRWERDSSAGWPKLTAEKIFKILDAYVGVWPKVHLPNLYGTGSPEGETAYRFLRDVTWKIENDAPDARLTVIRRLLSDARFSDFRNDLLSMKAAAVRQKSMQDFVVPSVSDVVDLLDAGQVASVEDLRALLLEELASLQTWINGAETNPLSLFWPHGKRVDENTARDRIVERLQSRFQGLDTSVVVEHQTANKNRCDFTLTKMFEGQRKLLACEVKGQWHSELFTAAQNQLHERYATHPDASLQGVYLVLWFGKDEKVAGLANKKFKNAVELEKAIMDSLPQDIVGLTSVFVLDVAEQS
jgi:hypothetical protein